MGQSRKRCVCCVISQRCALPAWLTCFHQTLQGNTQALKSLILCGGGTGKLSGPTRWIGENFVRGVHLAEMEISGGHTTLVGCRLQGAIRVTGKASLSLRNCTMDNDNALVDSYGNVLDNYGIRLHKECALLASDCSFRMTGFRFPQKEVIYALRPQYVILKRCNFLSQMPALVSNSHISTCALNSITKCVVQSIEVGEMKKLCVTACTFHNIRCFDGKAITLKRGLPSQMAIDDCVFHGP